MAGTKVLALMMLASGALAVPMSRQASAIVCPDQNETTIEVPFANPENCSTFYECDNGQAKLLACPANTFFSSKTRTCAFKKDSDCPKSASLFSLSLDDGDAGVNFTCPAEPDNITSTYYPNPANCSTFYECSNEVPVLLECPKKLYFNARLCVCTLPKKSHCTQPDDGDDGFEAFEDDASGIMSDYERLQLKEHLERVYSGRCRKQDL
ncbi:chondroitin proteoglycan 2-like [Bacillus rossius redtenbacheri]|uniref:chondroitin proteoglycan 2-like n=1 Tax=Bacillus rossius redtenbacheri TaxID=93214 RepID=UPI002FDDB156